MKPGFWRSWSRAEKALILLFLLSLPFLKPRVESDGIGYYAFARSILIDHNLAFKGDWSGRNSQPMVVLGWVKGPHPHVVLAPYTKTGHINNYFAVGPALLWGPFLATTHAAVLLLDHFGWTVTPDGHSRPYLVTLALATALYGFIALWLSFQLARKYFAERWAFLATLAIWLGSSLPVYLYLGPSWAHTDAAFTVALFLWYWDRTRINRSLGQWAMFGAISGLMCEVYYANFVFLVVPFLESISLYAMARRDRETKPQTLHMLLRGQALYGLAALVVCLPTIVVRTILFGSPIALSNYSSAPWKWKSPAFGPVLFSLSHGAIVWTPILLPAIAGIFLLWRRIPEVGGPFLAAACAFYLLISLDPWWDGVMSFGIRYFVSLTPIFIVGLACALSEFARVWRDVRGATWRAVTVSMLLIIWNLGLVYQWETHLIPHLGLIFWEEIVYNQFREVPQEIIQHLETRLVGQQGGPDTHKG